MALRRYKGQELQCNQNQCSVFMTLNLANEAVETLYVVGRDPVLAMILSLVTSLASDLLSSTFIRSYQAQNEIQPRRSQFSCGDLG